ncbi:MAG: M42 family metallopeptidase, partial [Candidatus Hydrothermarchaeaceae archaeon]
KEEERKKVVEHKDMFIDVGAKAEKDAAKLGVKVGDHITFDRSFKALGGEYITGKGFDDRLGCAVMVEVLKRIKLKDGVTLYAVGTVQEEVGLKGARTAAYKLDPDLALVPEVTVATDFPGAKDEVRTSLGKGPAITIADASGRGLITHPAVKDLLISTAEKNKIPYQLEVSEGGTTDATAIHLTKEGVPSGVVSIPTRYLHSPVEVANLKDIRNAIKLITLAIQSY